MLWTIAAVFIVLWLLGMITSTMIGGFIHVLLVPAVILIVINLFRVRKRRQLKLMKLPKMQPAFRRFTERENLFV